MWVEAKPCPELIWFATNKEIWAEGVSSLFFSQIHDPANLKGGCGKCLYNRICGGCRTRAYHLTGDWLGTDPACYLSGHGSLF